MKHEVIKNITLNAVIEKGDTHCKDFRAAINMVSAAYFGVNNSYLDGDDIIYWDWLQPYLNKENIRWLIQKGFIREVVPEVFYSIGDRFIVGDNEYLLCVHGSGGDTVGLSNLKTGWRRGSPKDVTNTSKITKEEMDSISGHGSMYEKFN